MKTFCFKLYKQIDAAGLIYNHCVALHRKYYKTDAKNFKVETRTGKSVGFEYEGNAKAVGQKNFRFGFQ